MEAWACQTAGGALAPFQYEPAPLGDFDCEIRITHCGLCHSDVHLIHDDWGISRYPLVPGHEIVGLVTVAGARAGLAPGQRVGVGWLRGACLECEQCEAGHENLCRRRQPTCVGAHGGFADRVRVDARFAFPLPDALESASAAPLLCGGITVFAPLRRLAVGPGMRVGIVGIGGLGHLAVKFARAMGAEVTAIAPSRDKADDARALGAAHFLDNSDEPALIAARGAFDVLLSTVAVDLPWQSYLQLLARHGTLCLLGAPPGPVSFPLDALAANESYLTAGSTGSRARMREMLAFAAQHGIGATVEVMPMAAVNDALERLKAGHARYRIVLEA